MKRKRYLQYLSYAFPQAQAQIYQTLSHIYQLTEYLQLATIPGMAWLATGHAHCTTLSHTPPFGNMQLMPNTHTFGLQWHIIKWRK
jgi:hypothetical protein